MESRHGCQIGIVLHVGAVGQADSTGTTQNVIPWNVGNKPLLEPPPTLTRVWILPLRPLLRRESATAFERTPDTILLTLSENRALSPANWPLNPSSIKLLNGSSDTSWRNCKMLSQKPKTSASRLENHALSRTHMDPSLHTKGRNVNSSCGESTSTELPS